MTTSLLQIIQSFPEGYSEGLYRGVKYGISKSTFNNGKSFKVFARALNGRDFVSLNYYVTNKKEWLKPCEMPEQKVVDFLTKVCLIHKKE